MLTPCLGFEQNKDNFDRFILSRVFQKLLTIIVILEKMFSRPVRTADRLAQLVEHRTALREVAASKTPRPDQHSGSLNN